MNKNYRGWKLEFAPRQVGRSRVEGFFIATKRGFMDLKANNRVGIERVIDALELIGLRDEAIATIKKANQLIRKLKQLTCENPKTN